MSELRAGSGIGLLVKRLAAGLGGKPKSSGKKSGAAAAAPGADTKLSRSLDQALADLAADSAQRILISGDRAFAAEVRAKAPQLDTEWASCLFADLGQGAANLDALDLTGYDAVLCGGAQAGLSYRHAVARLGEVNPARPVHWVGKDWEFCGGTLPVPSEADDAEALLFNHFQQFFGIKDPLLFRIEIYHGAERKHFTRILQPNESLVIRLSDHFPARSKPSCIAAFVSHPILTRGRHYRLRACADVFWRDSFTTLHSAHEFGRSPEHKVEFRAWKNSVRSGDIVLTLPNYARDLGEDRTVTVTGGSAPQAVARDPGAYLDEVKVTRNGGSDPFFGWKYRGYGGSFWYGFEGQQALADGHRGSLSSNHHVSVPVEERADWSASAEELAQLAGWRAAGLMIEPHAVPLMPETSELQFAIDFEGSNPGIDKFRIFAFSGEGTFLGEFPYERPERGPFSPAAILRARGDSVGDAARLAIVTPDWQAIKVRRKGFKMLSQMEVRNTRTGDRDVTEFQACWRNIGVMVPEIPTFAGPGAIVYGRSNLFARVRSGGGYRTALLSVNGSGNIHYRRGTTVEVSAFNLQGQAKSGSFALPPFGWRLDWIDDLIPGLDAHLGAGGVGPLIVGSKAADLNCQIVSVSDRGAVSIQHMWGY